MVVVSALCFSISLWCNAVWRACMCDDWWRFCKCAHQINRWVCTPREYEHHFKPYMYQVWLSW